VKDDQFEMGKIKVSSGGPIFRDSHTLFMKDTCTITAKQPATAVFVDHGDTIMAAAKVGKGTVFAVVDPWLYNEYTDGHKLPAAYDNFAAGKELVRWILQQVRH
jgi:unsaturated rhamnogalacturonyl hydrolase